ncbi:hypothetical protein WAI453_000894 [Rhynchosporium graminicola]
MKICCTSLFSGRREEFLEISGWNRADESPEPATWDTEILYFRATWLHLGLIQNRIQVFLRCFSPVRPMVMHE